MRRSERGGVVRSGRARRKTLPRTSAQSPRQLGRVTLLLFLLAIYLSFLLQPTLSLLGLRSSFSPPRLLRPSLSLAFDSFPPVLPRLRTFPPTSPSPRRLLFLIASQSPAARRRSSSLFIAARGPPPLDLFLSHPPLIVSFTFSQPLVEQAEAWRDGAAAVVRGSAGDLDFRVLRRPRITSRD